MFSGEKLRAARTERHWSQEKVASKLSFELRRPIRARQVIRHEQGTQPGADFIGAYARVFGLSVEHFLGDDEDEEAAQVSRDLQVALMEVVAAVRRFDREKVA